MNRAAVSCFVGALLGILLSTPAQALVVERAPNNQSFASAQNLDVYASLDFNADIGEEPVHTSLRDPHATVWSRDAVAFEPVQYDVLWNVNRDVHLVSAFH